jgi:hypothetical protein
MPVSPPKRKDPRVTKATLDWISMKPRLNTAWLPKLKPRKKRRRTPILRRRIYRQGIISEP